MARIVDRTVSTPTWHATATVIAIIATATLLAALAITAALSVNSMTAAIFAAGAGIAGIVAAVNATPKPAHLIAR